MVRRGSRIHQWLRGRRRVGLLTLLLLAVATVSAGCMDAEADVTVRDDRSGKVTLSYFPDQEVRRVLANLNVEEVLDATFGDVDGYEYSEVNRAGVDGYRVEIPFEDYRNFEPYLTNGPAIAGQPVNLFSSFALQELPDDQWSLDATLNPFTEIVRVEGDDPFATSLAEALQTGGKASGDGLVLTVSLPGKVVNSNATSISNGTALWEIDDALRPTRLIMRTEPKPLLTTLQIILLVSVGIVVVGVVLLLLSKNDPHGTGRTREARRNAKRHSTPSSAGWRPPEAEAPAPQLVPPIPAAAPAPGPPPMPPPAPPQPPSTDV